MTLTNAKLSFSDRLLFWRLRRRWRPICTRLGLREQTGDVRNLTGQWQGRSVRVCFRNGNRGERSRLSFHVAAKLPVSEAVQFRRMGWFDWLAKVTGLSREAEAGDPLFDQQVYCESWDDQQATALVANRHVREGVLAALRRRRTRLSCEPGGIWLTIRAHWGWGRHYQPDAVERIFEQLAVLADHVSAVDVNQEPRQSDAPTPQQATPPMKHLPRAARAFVIFGLISMFLGPLVLWFSSWYPPSTWQLHVWGWTLGGTLLAGYLLTTVTWLRGRSRAHRDLAVFAFAGLVGFPTLCSGGLVLANGLLDRSPPIQIEAEVLGHQRSDGNLYARLAFELPGHEQVARTRWRVAEEISTEDRVLVELKGGRLGELWISRITITESLHTPR